MISKDIFTIPGFITRPILAENTSDLQRLLVECVDYCMLVDGRPPLATAAVSMVTDRPEGRTIDDKLLVGLYTIENELIGVLDAFRNYPKPADWWIGLLLVAPQFRGQGLGHRVFQAFRKWIQQQGARLILLGVVEANENALRFWQSEGFTELDRQPARQFGNLSHVVITMQQELNHQGND